MYMRRAGAKLAFVIDDNPVRHGKYLAVSGLQALPPWQAMALLQQGDNVFVINSNYLDEIVARSGNQYHYCELEHE